MASVNTSEVTIGGKEFKISGYESKEYLTKLAEYINDKMQEMIDGRGMTKLGFDMVANLMYLNLADDYFKAKTMCDDISQEIEKKDQEIYDLKHELISANIKLDSQAKEIEALKKELSKANQNTRQVIHPKVQEPVKQNVGQPFHQTIQELGSPTVQESLNQNTELPFHSNIQDIRKKRKN